MKFTLIALLSLGLFSCNLFSKSSTPQAPITETAPQVFAPEDYKDSISYKVGEYAKIKVTGRCVDEKGQEMDGPKESIPLLDGDSASVKVTAVKSNKHKALYEVVQMKNPGSFIEMAAEQTGCSHFGVSFYFLPQGKTDLTKTDAVWKTAMDAFAQVPLSANGKKEVRSLETLIKNANAPDCKHTNGITICGKYEDPNNLEILAKSFEKDPKLTWIEVRYWYVM